jgi:GNAT superfamily N-acetyltransferase
MSLIIAPLTDADRADWERLARGYKAFYNTPTTDAEYERAWRRLRAGDEVFGLAAYADGKLVGIAHYLFHTVVWAPKVCYLQDLFTDTEARGRGVGRALIEAVAARAKDEGAVRYYWMTQEHNATARALYDKVAKFNGFIRYEFTLAESV